MVDEKLLGIIACPVCKRGLVYDKNGSRLICENCRLRYPIVDDIPIMLEDEAESY
ncbi:Trm112 family protein [bacterium]|nr:MAG: Trm112 family protein [bacterium]